MSVISSSDFEHFFKTHYRPLCLFALRYTDHLDDAEDIVQQTFSDIWDKIRDNHPILHLQSYAYQSVRNNSLSFIEKHPLCKEPTEEIAEFADLSMEEQIFCSERDARLWMIIDKLPPERRKILLLAKRDGLKYQEIADELKISVKTVENQMNKALKSLRETAIAIYNYFF